MKAYASNSDVWLNCTASIHFVNFLYLKSDTDDQIHVKQGIDRHALAEKCLKSQINKSGDVLVDAYLQYIVDLKLDNLEIEKQTASFYDTGINAYIDACGFDSRGVFHIIDAKFGYQQCKIGPQLKIYALNIHAENPDITEFCLHIVQPQRENKVLSLSIDELETVKINIFETYEKIRINEVSFLPGAKHCLSCVGRAYCNAHYKEIIEKNLTPALSTNVLELQICEKLYMQSAEIKSLLRAVETRILANPKKLKMLAVEIVESKKNRSWKDKSLAYHTLMREFKKSELITEKLVTPAQYEKLAKSKQLTKEFKEEIEENILHTLIQTPKIVSSSNSSQTPMFDDETLTQDEINLI